MDDQVRQSERKLRETWERGDYQVAATLALEAYAPEIMGFLMERLRGEDDASEVFSQFALDFWRGLPRFEWRSSLRAWAYALARNLTSIQWGGVEVQRAGGSNADYRVLVTPSLTVDSTAAQNVVVQVHSVVSDPALVITHLHTQLWRR